ALKVHFPFLRFHFSPLGLVVGEWRAGGILHRFLHALDGRLGLLVGLLATSVIVGEGAVVLLIAFALFFLHVVGVVAYEVVRRRCRLWVESGGLHRGHRDRVPL